MADYKERFEAMKAAEAAMKSTPRTPSSMANAAAAMKTSDRKPLTAEQEQRELDELRKREEKAPTTKTEMGNKKGGCVKMAKGGYVRAADGCAQRGKTRGKLV